jgi:hypothetical protein
MQATADGHGLSKTRLGLSQAYQDLETQHVDYTRLGIASMKIMAAALPLPVLTIFVVYVLWRGVGIAPVERVCSVRPCRTLQRNGCSLSQLQFLRACGWDGGRQTDVLVYWLGWASRGSAIATASIARGDGGASDEKKIRNCSI